MVVTISIEQLHNTLMIINFAHLLISAKTIKLFRILNLVEIDFLINKE